VQILLTNDDGIYAPGLAAMERVLRPLGDVCVVAPATEQSGVGHAITFLTPLTCKEIFDGERHRGWAVDGSPADCVKLGVFELSPRRPDLIVSGINGGLNAGINVLYSGTVAAAIEGAFFGIRSIAVSLEFDEHANYEAAAELAIHVIQHLVQTPPQTAHLFNLNIPTQGVKRGAALKIVPMGLARWGEHFEKRTDPKGRPYYWATGNPSPEPSGRVTDLEALRDGFLTLTPLSFDLTADDALQEMRDWQVPLPNTLPSATKTGSTSQVSIPKRR